MASGTKHAENEAARAATHVATAAVAAGRDTADHERTAFLAALGESLTDGTFLKLALGKYRGRGAENRITGTRVLLKDVPHLKLVTRAGTQEATRNVPIGGSAAREHVASARVTSELEKLIGGDYLSATLLTKVADISLVYSKKRVAKLTRGKPSMRAAPTAEHNRAKAYIVDVGAPYLKALGVTHGGAGDGGRPVEVKPSMYAKFRQICRFVEILDQLFGASAVREKVAPDIVDIGSGKGYLTFALHDHLVRARGKTPATRGIEVNTGLVSTCNGIATLCGMAGLAFEAAKAEDVTAADGEAIDILIALHACDTATDDAIHLGIKRRAELIVTAPCCQHELAPQLDFGRADAKGAADGESIEAGSRGALAGLLKHGLFRQREADLVTDAMRASLLETEGYEVRVIEFVSTEHTAKNIMLAAVRSPRVDRVAARRQLDALVETFGIREQRLMRLLGMSGGKLSG